MAQKVLAPVRAITNRMRRSIGFRLAFSVTALALVTVIVVATTVYVTARTELRSATIQRLNALADLKRDELSRWVESQAHEVRFVASLREIVQLSDAGGASPAAMGQMLDSVRVAHPYLRELMVLAVPGGEVVAASDSARLGEHHLSDLYFTHGRDSLMVQNVYPSPITGRPTMTVAAPLGGISPTTGVLVAHLDLTRIDQILADRSGLGTSGDVYLVSTLNDFVSSERFGREGFLRGVHSFGVSEALSGRSGAGLYENYAGVPVIGSYRWLGDNELALIVEMEQGEAFASVTLLVERILLVGLLSVVLIVIGVRMIARRVAVPVGAVSRAAERIAAGDFGVRAPVDSADEVGLLGRSFNDMARRLKQLYDDLDNQFNATRDAMHQLQESKSLLDSIADNSRNLVLVVGPDRRMRLANRALHRFFDLPDGSLVDDVIDRLPEEFARVCWDMAEHCLGKSQHVTRECSFIFGDESFWFSLSGFPIIDEDGAAQTAGIVAVDFSERKKAEDERLRLEVEIQHSQKLESLGLLAGGIAHDFNNILAGILGNADLALGELEAESIAFQNIQRVLAGAQRASSLTQQMLAYAGKATFRKEQVNVNELVREITNLGSASFPKKIRLDLQLDENLWLAEADPTQISQIVLNLITNAAEAIGDNDGRIDVKTANLDARGVRFWSSQLAISDGNWVWVRVLDTGAGMDERTRARIFDPFFTTKGSGRGLGLAAVIGIVKTSGGSMVVESEPGRGTSFEIVLPATTAAAARRTSGDRARAATGRGETVLVVDDEEPVRDLLEQALTAKGFIVISAADGASGVEAFRKNHHELAAVVLDMTMPKMNGHEVLAVIREINPKFPVVLSSGYDAQDSASVTSNDDYVAFLQKPYRPGTLARSLRDLIDGA